MIITISLSRLLGYGREVVMTYYFGINYFTDTYRAAFSVPDFLYLLLAGGAIGSALIPVFSAYLSEGNRTQAWKSVSIAFNYTMIVMLVLLIPAYALTFDLIRLLVPGLPQEYFGLAVYMAHIMFIQTVFMIMNGFSMGVLNSNGNFLAPAMGSLLYNVFIIIIGACLVHRFGITAFAYGVVVGAVISFLVQIPALRRAGCRYYLSFNWKDPGFKKIIALMVPVMIGLGLGQFNAFVSQNLASNLGAGVVTALNLAQKIINFPIGIFGVSIAAAIFPTLSVLAAQKDILGFTRATSIGLRAIIVIMIPAAVGLIIIGKPLLALCFQQGLFTPAMTNMIYNVLIFYALSLFAYAGAMVVDRGFYSLEDTKTPVIVSVIAIIANIWAALSLVGIMQECGLALAYSFAGIINLFILLACLRYKIGHIDGRKIIASLVYSMIASVFMAIAIRALNYLMLPYFDLESKLGLLLVVGIDVIIGVIVYVLALYPFHLQETELIIELAKRKLGINNGRL